MAKKLTDLVLSTGRSYLMRLNTDPIEAKNCAMVQPVYTEAKQHAVVIRGDIKYAEGFADALNIILKTNFTPVKKR